MINLMIIILVALIVGSAGLYIYKAKKRGHACVGCPHAKTCGSKCCCTDQ